ncbi:carotenoid oxygenase family protein [Peterkaempfera bronchialis]|uniref:Dioxygenase n=1 Tax=Peterkaempfera bronchialis TaxID=2126346 RepID=A0A345ST81_9ACTN|nr:carotenoid oxygenase family protein [Peterkaempfera bronchialis]AXI76936.1 dioxygenase [Peterkaempfera bronchialis]
MTEQQTSAPYYLEGHLSPVPDETDATGLEVVGTLPAELDGRYLRNGPNPLAGQDGGHWFAGHGMIHGVRLRDGRAEWYRNRWVRTRKLEGAPFVRDDFTLDLAATPANTHVVRHGEKLLALCETGLPYRLTPELDTVGPEDFGGRLRTGMTAHPKEDPVSGELHFFGYGFTAPYLTHHRLSADGRLLESREVRVPGPTMMHDFALTERHVIWLDLPVVFDLALVGSGMPYRWDEGYGARLGVMERTGSAEVTWYAIDPCYVFHIGNAHEDADGRIVLDAVRYAPESFAALWSRVGGAADPAAAAAATGGGALHRWTLSPADGSVREERLDDRAVEFPTHDDARTGRAHRYLWTVSDDAVVKYDMRTGAARERALGAGDAPGEAVFVRAAGAHGEDEGWLLSLVSDRAAGPARLVVLNAADLSLQAEVRLPRHVPAGFHGSWIPEEPRG